ncbi:glycerate kinase [Hydrogenoanaerobacterium saccharovorans]|uniref:Glycerate kinase n=1 Tax=Hydrogenoanaerobacterium saccharovorans TaxID=474960 RepID=A0A1H8CPD6_9FIRM|nr:glycerate kinase [Hydrogenoanaerobacterium saccharovorans]RPF43202.1 glycerate kinase [Hydrogenoanaerobacterium saccharovorans]SEM95987.1 glycerate kinase [Hydrogenoanaerobacterium saccharovorans]
MKKILLIPDSFKGTMSSTEICSIMEERIRAYYPDAEVISIPVADGGEGSVDSFLAAVGGKRVAVTVKGPYMQDIEAFYGVIDNGSTAVIEMAACAGLPLVGENRQAHKTTTYGVGQLMAHAAISGCKRMIVGLGGSATNDLGAGAAAALGVCFADKDGNEFVPVGENLSQIAHIDTSRLLPELKNIEIITMCDIDNPLYGKNGAAYVFAPQKGADPAMVEYLDAQLKAGAEVIRSQLGTDIAQLAGAGAAGGMGGGMVAFFGSRLQMGIETVLDTVGFDSLLQGADLVFTGEGKIDDQSLRGKVVIGVARRTKKVGVPLIAVVGDIGDHIEAAYSEGVSAVFSINRVAVDFSEAKKRSKSDMALTIDNLMRFIKSMNF